MRKLTYLAVFESNGGPGISVFFPDIVKDEMNSRREKTTVTIPHWLKSAAEAEGLNYSRLLESAIKETLGIAV